MKIKLILAVVLLLSFAFTLKKEKSFLPPGTVRINDTLYADKTEISNFSWWEYEFWIKTKYGENSPEHKAVIPDNTVWLRDGMTSNEPMQSMYYTSPAFRDYPVVGISYDQAKGYCKWRTEVVKAYVNQNGLTTTKHFEYRLPSREEWELLSGNGREVFNRKNEVICTKNTKDKKVYAINYQARCFINDSLSSFIYTSSVDSYVKNGYGMRNMVGNVSEMVLEKGISKGGSWKHPLEECRTGRNISYTGPEAWLGFRCVCVVKQVKGNRE